MKEKLIIIEGSQGAGKTTITNYIRNNLPYTNLYRLNGTSDSKATGLKKSEEMYNDLLDYMERLQGKSVNLLFDRSFFTEEVYCRLGFKEYYFGEIYAKLLYRLASLGFDIYYINLYLSDEKEFEKRLIREKCTTEYAKFKVESSIAQQKVYKELAEDIKLKFPNIKVLNVDTCKENKKVCEEVLKFIKGE